MNFIVSNKKIKMAFGAATLALTGILTGCQTSETVAVATPGESTRMISEGTPGSTQERFDSRMKLAATYYQGGSPMAESAMTMVNRALELRPRSPEALALKGMIYDLMGDEANAITSLKNAASYDPKNGDFQHNLGAMLCNKGQYSEGISYLENAINLPSNTNAVNSWFMVGVCYEGAGNMQKAETAYHQVLYMDPANVNALYRLGNFMHERNDIEGANEFLGRMGSMNNMSPQALWLGVKVARSLGDAYLMGQYAKVLREKYPSSAEAAALNKGDYHW